MTSDGRGRAVIACALAGLFGLAAAAPAGATDVAVDGMSDRADADLRAALDYYEYLAWLFNQGRLTITHSRLFFSDRIVDGWRLAGRYLGQDELSHVYSELTRFVRETPRKDLPPDACAYVG